MGWDDVKQVGKPSPPSPRVANQPREKSNGDGDDRPFLSAFLRNFTSTAQVMIPSKVLSWKGFLGVTVLLYAMNQKNLFPRPVTGVLSRVFFWPTLPITAGMRVGRWITPIDDTVVMGGAPFGFCGIPELLYEEYGVRGVVNMCDEYAGPSNQYEQLGMEEIRLKTVDHSVPSMEDLKSAVGFIRRYQARGEKVYVHCRAGHGRSAAAVLAWLMYKDPIVDLKELNQQLRQQRYVRKSLWKQRTIYDFHQWLLRKDGKDPIMKEVEASFKETLYNEDADL